jgi:hypothetical protein
MRRGKEEEVEDQDVEALVAEFEAICEDPEKFAAFVNAAAERKTEREPSPPALRPL